jgi:hypothetical protein
VLEFLRNFIYFLPRTQFPTTHFLLLAVSALPLSVGELIWIPAVALGGGIEKAGELTN